MMMNLKSWIAVAAVALTTGGCSRGSRPAAASAGAARTGFSLYDVGGTWRDQTGATTTLASLRGTPTVITLMYARCSTSCPIAVATMKRIEAAAPGVRLVLVSLDPERDTPGTLAMYARMHDLSAERWTLLSGSDSDVRALAMVLGIRYRWTSDRDVAHTNLLTLLDTSGAVVLRQTGFGAPDATVRAARQLAAKTTIARN